MQIEVRIDSGIETQTNQRLADDALNRGPDKERLIAEHRQFEILRNILHDPGESILHGVDDRKRRRISVAGYGQQDAARAVCPDYVLLRNESVVDRGHILYVYGGAVDGLDRQIVKVRNNRRTAVQPHRIFGTREFRSSRRQDQILKIEGV
jgi:hypothetical protein